MRPFLTDIKWPGRRIQSVPGIAASGQTETRPAAATPLAIVPAANHAIVQERFSEADHAVQDLERHAETVLRPLLGLPVHRLPQTAESVMALAGTHPAFGSDRPAVPADEQLDDSAISYEIFDRAYNTIQNADRILFGFDAEEIASDSFDGTVKPYGTITSPAVAAGERPASRLDDAKTLTESIEDRLTMRKVEIWKMVFKAIIAYVVRYFADIVKRMGDRIASTLTIKILGKRIRLGRFLAKPLYWLAKLLYELADRLEREAMAMEPPRRTAEPTVDRLPDDTLIPDPDADVRMDEEDVTLTDPDDIDVAAIQLESMDTNYDASSGQFFLMHASNVLQAVQAASSSPGQHELRRGLQLYEAAKELRSQVNNFHQIAGAWGVPSGLALGTYFDLGRVTGGASTSPSTPGTALAPPTLPPDAADPAFACDVP